MTDECKKCARIRRILKIYWNTDGQFVDVDDLAQHLEDLHGTSKPK